MVKPVVHALLKKRGLFQAELEHHQRHAEACAAKIATIDATLELWDEAKDAPRIRKVYRAMPEPFKWNELPRIVVRTMRAAGGPLPVREIQRRVMEAQGIVPADAKERNHWQRRFSKIIHDKRRQGVVRSAGVVGALNLWELVPDREMMPDARRLASWGAVGMERSRKRNNPKIR